MQHKFWQIKKSVSKMKSHWDFIFIIPDLAIQILHILDSNKKAAFSFKEKCKNLNFSLPAHLRLKLFVKQSCIFVTRAQEVTK